MTRFFMVLVIGMAPLLMICAKPAAGGDEPLLIEGKRELYQRVLSVPGARMATYAGGERREAVTPFTAFYVYSRRMLNGTEWVEVGTDRHGTRAGWLPLNSTLEWNHGLTATFRDPAGHDRVLLFRNRDSVSRLAREPDSTTYDRLYREAVAENLSKDSPVVAIQPPGYIDIRDDFYLVPIRRYEDIYLGGERARLLEVSSVPMATEAPMPEEKPAGAHNYTAGLAFVIDSTLSMDPYIDRTLKAVERIYDSLGSADLLGNANFGLVAFRDDPAAAPGLDYLTRTYVDLEQGRDGEGFLSRVKSLQAASVSSTDFREDAYAGVKQAIESMNWAGHDARYIVLVTDAGARDADDPLSSTGLGTASLRQLALDKGIAIFVLHLLTPDTMADHAQAAMQYRELAYYPDIGSLYYSVPTGDVARFGRVLDALAGQITEQVRIVASGGQAVPAPTSGDEQLANLQAKVAKLGHALRMRYLQKSEGGRVPSVFNAWMLDRDFKNPERPTLDVRVLLTRDQLSELHDVLTQVLNTAEQGLMSPQNFLDELKSLAATVSRSPEQLGGTTATTAGKGNSLADLGFIQEYIEDLPYTGEVMGLSLDDWQNWSTLRQVDFLNRLEEKVSYYRALHDHTDLWVSLDGGPVGGDSVYPVPLEMLP